MQGSPERLQVLLAAWAVLHAVGGLVFAWIPMLYYQRHRTHIRFRMLAGPGARKVGLAYVAVAVLSLLNVFAGLAAMVVVAAVAWRMGEAQEP